MKASDLIGLEKPLTKLVETVSEGFGTVGNSIFQFDVKRITRVSAAKAEAEKVRIIKKAEGEAAALGVLERASKRHLLDQYNRQINLENIVVKAKPYLNAIVSEIPVEKDWTSRFLSIAQEVSREEVQDLLAKILAREVSNPNSYSLRTLEVIRNLSKNELEDFKRFIALSSIEGFFHIHGANREPLKKYGLNFGSFVHLADIGLFNPFTMLSINVDLKANVQNFFQIGNEIYSISSNVDKNISMGVLKFTETGSQIFGLLNEESLNPKLPIYREDLIKFFESNNVVFNRSEQ